MKIASCLFEEGGANDFKGRGVVVTQASGAAISPVAILKVNKVPAKKVPYRRQAVHEIQPGYKVVEVAQEYGDVIYIGIDEVVQDTKEVDGIPYRFVRLVTYTYWTPSEGWSNGEPTGRLKDAVEAAKAKAFCKWCRHVHYKPWACLV